MGTMNGREAIQRGRREWHDEENEPIQYDMSMSAALNQSLDAVSVEKYLTYNNPHITSFANHNFVSLALSTARACDILPNSRATADFFATSTLPSSNMEDATKVFVIPNYVSEVLEKQWREQIGNEVTAKRRLRCTPEEDTHTSINSIVDSAYPIGDHIRPITKAVWINLTIDAVSSKCDLNYDQKRAYDLFLTPLKSILLSRTLASNEIGNRCMYLGGPGGTGKSRVINAISEAFRQLQCLEKLFVAATTGFTASLIGGSTIDSLCKLRRRKGRSKDGENRELEVDFNTETVDNSWAMCEFIIIDEVSMLGCAKLAKVSKALRKNKSCALPFGGVYILFGGDFHQLPAVADKCLYRTQLATGRKGDSDEVKEGMLLWSNVIQSTILLTEHYRATNPDVHDVMDRIRRGTPLPSDIDRIKSRVFGHLEGPDINDPKWQTAPLITPRNNIRQAWNNHAAVRYSIQTNTQIFISPSIDEGIEADRNAMIWTGDNKTDMLATWNVLCIDAVAIVTVNIAVELHIANGSKVIIREVIPHPDDRKGWEAIRTDRIVRLSRPPITVFVEPIPIGDFSPSFTYHPLHSNWFPIMPFKHSGIRSSVRESNIFPHTDAIDLGIFNVGPSGPGFWT